MIIGAKFQNRHAANGIMTADNDAHRTTASRDFLEHDRAGNVVQACAAPFFRHGDAHESETPHLGNELTRVTSLLIPSDSVRQYFLAGETPCDVSDLVMNIIFDGVHWGFR